MKSIVRTNIYKNPEVGINPGTVDPINWIRLVIPELKVPRYEFKLGLSWESRYDEIRSELFLYQRQIEFKFSVIDYLSEHSKEYNNLKIHNISILSYGEELY